jgi:hypothetical protein
MRHLLAAVLSAVLFDASATTASAATAPVSQVQADQAEAATIQAWLAGATQWSGRYTDLMDARVNRLTALMDGSNRLIELLNARKSREARAWVQTWATEQKAGLAADYDAYGALPPHPPAAPAAIDGAEAERLRQEFITLRDRVGTLLIQTRISGEAYIDLVVAAASGRPNDIRALGSGAFTVMAAHLQAENVMMENLRGEAGEPNYYFTSCMLESNLAMMIWARAAEQRTLGKPVDLAAAGAAMRSHTAAVRQASADLKTAVDQTEEMLASEPGLQGTPLLANLTGALATLRMNATVEGQIADALDRLAAAMEASDQAGQEAGTANLKNLVDRRMALFQQRQALIAQGGA